MAEQEKLAAYAALVRRYASRIDLVSPGDLERFEERHIEDSLRLRPLLHELPAGVCADVGSGAGLPGLVLAIADPDRSWRLLEPRARRAAFLEEVVRELELECEVIPASAAEAGRQPRLARAHALAVARALAPPVDSFDALVPLVAPGGAAAVFVGPRADIPAEAGLWRPGIARLDVPADPDRKEMP